MSYGLPAQPTGQVPTCYRHPEREAWIQCTRCGRTICPECMKSADVGYQCPECVRAGVATTRRKVTIFGGHIGREGAVSMSLIGVCVAAFVVISVLGMLGGNSRWAMQPLTIAVTGEYGRLISAMFLHAGLLHIALNMYALYLLGPSLEGALGHGRFLTLYLVSGFGGCVASYLFSPLMTASVGASGAIFGLMASWVVVNSRLQADPRPVLYLLGINVVLGFVIVGIDWRAHLGGALVGALVAAILTTGRGREAAAHRGRQAALVGAVVLALIGLVAWRTQVIEALVVGSIG